MWKRTFGKHWTYQKQDLTSCKIPVLFFSFSHRGSRYNRLSCIPFQINAGKHLKQKTARTLLCPYEQPCFDHPHLIASFVGCICLTVLSQGLQFRLHFCPQQSWKLQVWRKQKYHKLKIQYLLHKHYVPKGFRCRRKGKGDTSTAAHMSKRSTERQ